MNTNEAIRIALQSLWANKLRSLLTLLGVVIGVAAVIAVVTFVAGINGYVANRIFRLGADVFMVFKISPVVTSVDQVMEGEKRKDITMDEYRVLAENCRQCQVVAAAGYRFSGKIKYAEQSSSDTIVGGWTPAYVTVYDLELQSGRVFTEADEDNASRVAIIGNDILENIMAGVDPIGKEIRIDGQPYQVIGVGKAQGKTLGQSRDNYVFIPLTAWFRQYGARQTIRVAAKAYGVENLDAAMDEARALLRARRHDMPGKPDSFSLETNSSFMSIWNNLTGSFAYAMIAIAGVALVVGGIVIMNIMLVSVIERTREIGVRKAVGARRDDVLRQFLVESIILAMIGGFIGVLLGITLAKTVTYFIGMPSEIKAWSIIAGLLVSTLVGVFFGVYPARRAANLDPIAALRFEQ